MSHSKARSGRYAEVKGEHLGATMEVNAQNFKEIMCFFGLVAANKISVRECEVAAQLTEVKTCICSF